MNRLLLLALVVAVAAPPTTSSAAEPAPAPSSTSTSLAGLWDIHWDWSFAGWEPPEFHGRLKLTKTGGVWTGEVHFRESGAQPKLRALVEAVDHVDAVFGAESGGDPVELWMVLRGGDRFVGEMRWGQLGWTPVGGRRAPMLLQPAIANAAFPAVDAKKAGVDEATLQRLIEDADGENSSALVVVKDGHTVVERYATGYDGGPLIAMSASKSVTSLAVGLLIAEKKLTLETTLGEVFPEWRDQTQKASITIRQLLNHTSGLDQARTMAASETIREHVEKAKVVFAPGSRFQYNNNAVDLLSVVVTRRAGRPLDAYLDDNLFQKLGITDASWKKDTEGNPLGAGELMIRPVDFAKIGQLLLDGGLWKGKRILPKDWIDLSLRPAQPFMENCGFLWWRDGTTDAVLDEATLGSWRDAGVAEATLLQLKPLVGKKMSHDEYRKATRALLSESEAKKLKDLMASVHLANSGVVMKGEVRGFSARGWLGQFLVVDPKRKIIGVRMRKPTGTDYADNSVERDGFSRFPDAIHDLAAAAR